VDDKWSDEGIIVPPSGAQIDPAIVLRGEARTIPWIVRQIGGQLPWSHIKVILDKLSNHAEALFYLDQTTENGWSRDILRIS